MHIYAYAPYAQVFFLKSLFNKDLWLQPYKNEKKTEKKRIIKTVKTNLKFLFLKKPKTSAQNSHGFA